MSIIVLKILPEYYKEVLIGNKTFEIRKNDKDSIMKYLFMLSMVLLQVVYLCFSFPAQIICWVGIVANWYIDFVQGMQTKFHRYFLKGKKKYFLKQ